MITLEHREYSQAEWEQMISGSPRLSFIQTWEYGQAKARLGPWTVFRATFWNGSEPVGVVQALVRRIPGTSYGLVWINRGPVMLERYNENYHLFREVIGSIRAYWVREKHMYLRLLPPLSAEELNKMVLMNTEYIDTHQQGWSSAKLNLKQSLQSLRANLDQKWRNSLNKAEKSGLSFEFGWKPELFEGALNSYQAMLNERNYETTLTKDFLVEIQNLLPPERKLLSFAATSNGINLGAVIVARYGRTFEYLIGAVNEAGRKLNAGQFLLWQAVCQAKQDGYEWFDLGGLDQSRTTTGVYHFKIGVNPQPYRLANELEAYEKSLPNKLIKWSVNRSLRTSRNE